VNVGGSARSAEGSGAGGVPHSLRDEVAAIRWFHRIDLGNGIVTPGVDQTQEKLARIRLPRDLTGKSVLDIGAWDGFFSFEAERRGAARVLAIDQLSWLGATWGSKAGFDLAKRVLGSRVEEHLMDALDLQPERVGTFDLVLYLGLLYHMRHPLLALERVRSVTGERLILESYCVFRYGRPVLEFYPGRELLGDETNWFGPNPEAVEALLRVAGFRHVERVSAVPGLPRRIARAFVHALRGLQPFDMALHGGRVVYHARP